jgi:hypothetical protein
MTDTTEQRRAIDALAREVVAEVSPAELPLFGATAARYHADPAAALATGSHADETLGFGVETVAVLLAPFALDLVKKLFVTLAEKLGEGAADGIVQRVLARFGHDPQASAAATEAPLTPAQLAIVGDTARTEAAQLALPPEQAEALANAVVAALATRT